jgi:hypothetical protein
MDDSSSSKTSLFGACTFCAQTVCKKPVKMIPVRFKVLGTCKLRAIICKARAKSAARISSQKLRIAKR